MCEILTPRLITNGGNIILVQVENEYGSYGNDKKYLAYLKSFYEEHGVDCPLITSDGAGEFWLSNGTLDGVLASVNYRTESRESYEILKEFRPDQPGAVMELWNGRAMYWQTEFERRDVDEVKESVRTSLLYSELVNMYMFHGGTSFGFMNGTVDFGNGFCVQRTSYDVDAPLDEYGRRTPKYYAEQEVICKALGKDPVCTASDTVLADYENVRYVGECSLDESGLMLDRIESLTAKPMEQYDCGYGYIIYETDVYNGCMGGKLMLAGVHDIAHVYVDGKYVKTVCRNDADKNVEIAGGGKRHIEIIVENLGRINYREQLMDRKGIVGDVLFCDNATKSVIKVFGFTVRTLDLETLPDKYCGKAAVNKPAFYKYELCVDEAQDTVLRLDGFTRGIALMNGFNLGRHWDIETGENKLFVPASIINKGLNEIVIFDILAKDAKKIISFGE